MRQKIEETRPARRREPGRAWTPTVCAVTMIAVEHPQRQRPAAWTPEEVERERRAQQARVRRDAARTADENIRQTRALTQFAIKLAEAGRRARSGG